MAFPQIFPNFLSHLDFLKASILASLTETLMR